MTVKRESPFQQTSSTDVAGEYDAHYYEHNCGRPYKRDQEWLSFFGSIAQRIVDEITPSTVLDAGCAMGFLVEALRDRGVEAYGVDISEYAIQSVHPTIQDYCRVGSLTEPLLKKYDLIVCIEVLEHISPNEIEVVAQNLCAHTDDVLFSSTPFDYKEGTHFNVQPPDYWARLFARHGLFRDVEFDASFITPWAARFLRRRQSFARIVAGYERQLWQLQKEVQGSRQLAFEQRQEISRENDELRSLIKSADERDRDLKAAAEHLTQAHEQLTKSYKTAEILNSQLIEANKKIESLRKEMGEQAAAKASSAARLINSQRAVDSLSTQLADKEYLVSDLSQQLAERERQLSRIQNTLGWRLLSLYGRMKHPYLLPLYRLYGRIKYPFLLPIYRLLGWADQKSNQLNPPSSLSEATQTASNRPLLEQIDTIEIKDHLQRPVQLHTASVDIIVCVHNAPDDTKRCLESVIRYTRMPYSLILVDDGSDQATSQYLSKFADFQDAKLIRNSSAKGYTRAANQGLALSSGDYVVLLNSDTLVTPEWLDRMIACAESDPRIGIVGPLSNTASWQSIPEVLKEGDWHENSLPNGWSAADMARVLASSSGGLYPRIRFLNGFCIMIKRPVIEEIGYFDEALFGDGYGEENDYCLRAYDANWELAIADDAYIYHSQSKSYSHERRRALSQRADENLTKRHGRLPIDQGVHECRFDRVLEGIRARARVLPERCRLVEDGMERWEGKRVLFILPIAEPGGGANVILAEAAAMLRMGIDARILNLEVHKPGFESGYPNCALPVIYVADQEHVADYIAANDAVIATYCGSVYWMGLNSARAPRRGYYVQDFEPFFFQEGSQNFNTAWHSYNLYPDLIRVTKTDWNRRMVCEKLGVDCTVVGPSVDIDLFRPRRRIGQDSPQRPLRIAALVRPSTPRRNAKLTMQVLKEIANRFTSHVEITIFGCRSDHPDFLMLPRDFNWRNAGILDRSRLALLMNEIDVFVDFSAFQAMGLTAMEAMACGAAVVVPQEGGCSSFVTHEITGLVADTTSSESCIEALTRLVSDEGLRREIQGPALHSICQHFPERAAYTVLETIFSRGNSSVSK